MSNGREICAQSSRKKNIDRVNNFNVNMLWYNYHCRINPKKVQFREVTVTKCLPQRLKSTFFGIFSNGAVPKGPVVVLWSEEKISKNVGFSLYSNRNVHYFPLFSHIM